MTKNETILEKIDRMIFELSKEKLLPEKISFSNDGFYKFKNELKDSVLIRECIEKESVMGIPFETVDQEEYLIIAHKEFKTIRSTTGEPIFIIEEDPVYPLSPAEIEYNTLRQAARELVECIFETSLGKFLILIVETLASALNEVSRK